MSEITTPEADRSLEMLELHDAAHEETREEIQESTLELFRIIRKCFPQESEIKYSPIDPARRAMKEKQYKYDRNNNAMFYFLLHLYFLDKGVIFRRLVEPGTDNVTGQLISEIALAGLV
jgi:hypothetical protein